MSVLVDDSVAEGVYELAAVAVTSAKGIRGRRAVIGTSLRVDRTAPALFGATLIAPPDDRTYANVAGVDVVTVGFSANEAIDLSRSRVELGSLTGRADGCVVAGERGFECALSIPADAPDGSFTPRVVVFDLAGNQASVDVGDDVRVDTAAPALVNDSVRLLITTGGRPAAAATPASVVSVSFIVSEPLGIDPEVTLVDAGVPLTLRSRQGQSYTFELVTGLALPDGVHPVAARLQDRFGHAATVVVVDDVPFADGNSACPPAPGTSCVDVDGDGHALRDPIACPDGRDLDDLDPTVSPAGLELPGDGKDNDQLGGDQPIDENAGVFVDSDDGDDGSSSAPVRTLDVALDRRGDRRFLFLAAAAAPYRLIDVAERIEVSVVGGLDPADGWRRTAQRSVVDAQLATSPFDPVAYDGIDAVAGISGNNRSTAEFFIVRSGINTFGATPGTRAQIIDSDVAAIDGAQSAVRVVRSRLGTIVGDNGDFTLSSCDIGGLVQVGGGRLNAVNTFFGGRISSTSDQGGDVSLFHCTVLGAGVPSLSFASGGSLVAVGSVFARTNNGPRRRRRQHRPHAHRLQLSNTGGALLEFGALLDDVADLNACAFSGCSTASGNTSVAPGFATVFHLSPGSALTDNGVVASDFGAPFAVAADVDGDCRYADGAADLGADEVL